MINALRNSAVGYRRRGGIPAVLSDGNTVAWFDLAENITKDGSDFVSVWGDKSGNGNDLLRIPSTRNPLWTTDGVLFDGIDDFMKCVTFTYAQPEQIYIVVKQISWTSTEYLFTGNTDGTSGGISQRTGSPGLAIQKNGTLSPVNNNLAVGVWGILRILFNGATSTLRIDNTTPTPYNAGANSMSGFTLGATGGFLLSSHIQVKEVILRKIVDSATDEANIYNYLKSKYLL